MIFNVDDFILLGNLCNYISGLSVLYILDHYFCSSNRNREFLCPLLVAETLKMRVSYILDYNIPAFLILDQSGSPQYGSFLCLRSLSMDNPIFRLPKFTAEAQNRL